MGGEKLSIQLSFNS